MRWDSCIIYVIRDDDAGGVMAIGGQQDLFATQGDLFGAPEPLDTRPKPEEVRAELHALLAKIKSAKSWPWKPAHIAMYKTIFPQMTNWLPEDEARQLRLEFEQEVGRLEAL